MGGRARARAVHAVVACPLVDIGDAMASTTFVAVGDSFTEGLHDEVDGRLVGWADRVAAALAGVGEVAYANLAVRGKLLDEVVADQLHRALALRPDVLSFHAGGNDVLRPGADLDAVARGHRLAVRRCTDVAPTVLVFTVLERSGDGGGSADRLAARIRRFNDQVRATADATGAVLVDLARADVLTDRRLWHADRLHLSSAGHQRVAQAVLAALGRPHDPTWDTPLPPAPPVGALDRARDDAGWVRHHLLPWVGRRLRGVSSGDGLAARRPVARPVEPGLVPDRQGPGRPSQPS